MSWKIIPPLILKTFKEFKNAYVEDGIGNQNNIRPTYNTGHNNPPNIKSNKTKTARTLELLPITLTIIPVIFAVQCKPEKPPLMKYTDLPIYDAPHCIYKESQENRDKCPKCQQKLTRVLISHVKRYRCCITKTFEDWFDWAECQVSNAVNAFRLRKGKFLCYMRDDKNLNLRKVVVALGIATGIVFGSKNYYLLRNLPSGILVALFTGWLCFPEDTDRFLRHISYYVAKTIVNCLNYCFGDQCQKIPFERRSPLIPCLKDCFESTVYSEDKVGTSDCNKSINRVTTDVDLTILKDKVRQVLEEHLKEEQNANDQTKT